MLLLLTNANFDSLLWRHGITKAADPHGNDGDDDNNGDIVNDDCVEPSHFSVYPQVIYNFISKSKRYSQKQWYERTHIVIRHLLTFSCDPADSCFTYVRLLWNWIERWYIFTVDLSVTATTGWKKKARQWISSDAQSKRTQNRKTHQLNTHQIRLFIC